MNSDKDFSILKFRAGTPALAGCMKCEVKFLTPKALLEDRYAANEYLLKKYREHRCMISKLRTQEDAIADLYALQDFAPRK